MIVSDKLQNIYNKLFLLLQQFRNINVKSLASLPNRIGNAVFGENKIPSFLNKTIQEVAENDLFGVTVIENGLFKENTSLISVAIPEGVTSIEAYAFYGCENLKNVTIPDTVTSIGYWTFKECRSLTNITIPEGVTSIGQEAFWDCESLTVVEIPSGVTSIGEGAFGKCPGLSRIIVDEDNQYYSNDNYNVLFDKNKTILIQYSSGDDRTEYIVPDTTTTIGYGAFFYSNNLISIIIPDSVTTIESLAMSSCNRLSHIYLYSTTPPALRYLGINTVIGCPMTIHVPVGSGDVYKSATNWSSLADNIVEDITV